MGGYFKPLRRKLGVVTLAVACLLAAGWIRSLWFFDMLVFPAGPTIKGVQQSLSGSVAYHFTNRYWEPHPRFEAMAISNFTEPDQDSREVLKHILGIDWVFCGFYFGMDPLEKLHWMVVVPYWFLTALTVSVSSWQLLSRVRVSKSKPASASSKA